ncbi:hypothetical protein C8J56DRAFT_799406 [Mycena floridula]|nr:hypothetical protein C8J56DRAFT_799406 [Mycena floridula]
MSTTTELQISLESHLVQALIPVQDFHPELNPFLSEPRPATIPYSQLAAVSRWSRTEAGQAALESYALLPSAYSMLSLLAGTTTSPNRRFPDYIPPKEPDLVEAERIHERKAITTIINGLLSVGGSGVAAWWASAKTGWRDEWRVLFSLFVGLVVAISETVLYLLWQSRRSNVSRNRSSRMSAKHKRSDGDTHRAVAAVQSSESPKIVGLRQRAVQSNSS